MEFLNSRGRSYQRRTLLTPTTNDFKDIFNFIYQHLDPNYTLPPRFEEEIPKILKNLHCPLQITKSSFVTVGGDLKSYYGDFPWNDYCFHVRNPSRCAECITEVIISGTEAYIPHFLLT
ncbi:Kinetochore protein NDC80 [Portunus trituberculatus]|uniref:Kinetochore protein NDC80 n=1 Tax=Portunus trituberculatus TaxID=210409 RepID=A0A5B7F841_PORTR|nr:Kinetochore protein NDC80 [Portunus trituberculatus]